jgi:N-methylhydantoinase A
MEAEGQARLTSARHEGPRRIHRAADMRYGEQIFEIAVPLDGIDMAAADLPRALADAFHARHAALYTYAMPEQEAVLVNARAAIVGALPALPQEPRLAPRPAAGPRTTRRIHLGAWHEVPVYDLESLAPGQSVAGPAVVESPTTTILLRARDTATVTPFGWLDIAVD